jgi:hydrogenase expression/formation protein HypE
MPTPPNFENFTCPLPLQPGERVVLGHGSGGKLSRDLLARVILPALGEAAPRVLDDSAVVDIGGGPAAFTTDSYVVRPLFFPGGDIGRLAVCGTVNDLSMIGAEPIALSCGFVLEEGLELSTLERVARSMRAAALEAGVYLAAGDTKVVEKGKADGLFINTSGIGRLRAGKPISGAGAKSGDVILLSGAVGAGIRNRPAERRRPAQRPDGGNARGGRGARDARPHPRRAGNHAVRDRRAVRRLPRNR